MFPRFTPAIIQLKSWYTSERRWYGYQKAKHFKKNVQLKGISARWFIFIFLPVIESNENWQQKYGVHQLQMFDD